MRHEQGEEADAERETREQLVVRCVEDADVGQHAHADFDAAEEPGDGRCAKGAVESLRALADDVFELQLELLLDGTLVVAVSPAFVGAPLVIVSHASILAGRGRACGDLTTGRPRASGRRASAERKLDRAVTSV